MVLKWYSMHSQLQLPKVHCFAERVQSIIIVIMRIQYVIFIKAAYCKFSRSNCVNIYKEET